jgi:hypothetical protein
MEYEERVEQVPVRVCRQEAVQQTVQVPVTVQKRVPITYTYRVPHCEMRWAPTAPAATVVVPAAPVTVVPDLRGAPAPAANQFQPVAPGQGAAQPRQTFAEEPRTGEPTPADGTTTARPNGAANGAAGTNGATNGGTTNGGATGGNTAPAPGSGSTPPAAPVRPPVVPEPTDADTT